MYYTNEKKRQLIPYGYVLYNGAVMSDSHVDGYNAIQDRINAAIDAGMPVREELLNESHCYINTLILVSNGQ